MIDTFYVHLEFKFKNGEWSINLPFLCNQCGVCCTLDDFLTAGKVKINTEENPQLHAKLKSLYEGVGKRWETDETEYNHYIMHTPCPFLKSKKCSIYPVRPEGCRQFPKTPFGLRTENCEPLNRFKQQSVALSRGRKAKRTFHFTTDALKQPKFSENQYHQSIAKLQKSGITDEELKLFELLNRSFNEK